MTQFQVLPQKSGKGFDTSLRGLSVDECASSCVDEETYNCQSFHYCWNAGACFLSRRHPDEQPNMLRDTPSCDLYIRESFVLPAPSDPRPTPCSRSFLRILS